MRYIILFIFFIIYIYICLRFTNILNFRFKRWRKNINYCITKPVITQKPIFFQIYINNPKSKIPKDVYENISKYAIDYDHIILGDNESKEFLLENFEPIIFDTFNNMKYAAHKADLLRYCLLFVYGGVYMDIGIELLAPISDIFTDKNTIYSSISFMRDHLNNGIISTPSRHPLFLSLIYYIVKTGNPLFYHDFCKDFLYQIETDLNCNVKSGLNIGLNSKQNYYLLTENCSRFDCSICNNKFDKYGLCCIISDKGKPIIKTRRSDYPW